MDESIRAGKLWQWSIVESEEMFPTQGNLAFLSLQTIEERAVIWSQ